MYILLKISSYVSSGIKWLVKSLLCVIEQIRLAIDQPSYFCHSIIQPVNLVQEKLYNLLIWYKKHGMDRVISVYVVVSYQAPMQCNFMKIYIELTQSDDHKTLCFVAKKSRLTLKMHYFSNSENIKLKNCSPECRFLIF